MTTSRAFVLVSLLAAVTAATGAACSTPDPNERVDAVGPGRDTFVDVSRALETAGRLDAAWLVERGTMPGQTVRRLCDTDRQTQETEARRRTGPGRRAVLIRSPRCR